LIGLIPVIENSARRFKATAGSSAYLSISFGTPLTEGEEQEGALQIQGQLE
jgi:hypothetical protein